MNEYIRALRHHYTVPCLAYDLSQIREKLVFINEAANENNLHILFAVKSFPCPEVLELVRPYVHGFEISNMNEYKLLPSGNYNYISVSDPTLNLPDLLAYTQQKEKEIFYNLDHFDKDIADSILSVKNYSTVKFGLRLSHTALGITSSSYRTGIKHSRFGIELQQVKALTDSPLISGLHIHNGSEMNNFETYLLMARKIIDSLEDAGKRVNYINLGGGLGTLTENQILILFMELKNIIPPKCKIFFEPGYFFSKDAGYVIAQIKNIKQTGEKSYAVTTDISYEANLKWSSPRYYSFCENYSGNYVDVIFYGASCFEGDIIQHCKIDRLDYEENIKKGSVIFFTNISGYALAWNHSFNGIPKAKIYLCDENKYTEIV